MSDTIAMATSAAQVLTAKAQGYLVQLCRHFAHKTPVTYAGDRGRIEFGAGVCELDAGDAGVLKITVSAPDDSQLATLEDVVERHLKRFAFKEELTMAWVRD